MFLYRKAHLSSKKLLEQSQKIEKLWNHVLTGTLHLHADNWYNKVRYRIKTFEKLWNHVLLDQHTETILK
jgi:hypothetical protein